MMPAQWPRLRLVCQCGRNLADVRMSGGEPHVTARPNVRQVRYVPPSADPPDPFALTSYTWHCRCGKKPQMNDAKIGIAMLDRRGAPGVVRLILA